uniref:ISXO2-like transposase domain-containing protein n=1 Tax=Romanomermis culicivorax TaxID=13658 RepID=A0A915LB63_ROMCU
MTTAEQMFSLTKLSMVITNKSTRSAIDWSFDHGLLKRERYCQNGRCVGGGNRMRLEDRNTTDGVIWRCPVRICRKTVSIRKDSYFSHSHLGIDTVIQLAYMWAFEIDKQNFLMRELEIGSRQTIVDWKQFCRDICHEYFIMYPIQIGGPGHTVEIDESCFVRRKYERGHLVKEQWVFAGYDVETKESFMVPVARRNAATLLPLIQQYIRPGTTIISDMWGAYNTVANLGYQHLTVNHSINFVDPLTGATTNHVESVWQKAKTKNKLSATESVADKLRRSVGKFRKDRLKLRFTNLNINIPDAGVNRKKIAGQNTVEKSLAIRQFRTVVIFLMVVVVDVVIIRTTRCFAVTNAALLPGFLSQNLTQTLLSKFIRTGRQTGRKSYRRSAATTAKSGI